MTKKYLIYVFLISIFILPSLVLATSYSLSATSINNNILQSESAQYTVTISNTGTENGDFRISSTNPSWNIKTDPENIVVPANSQKTFTIYIQPTGNNLKGTQGVPIIFSDLTTGTSLNKMFILNLISKSTPTVAIDTKMPSTVDPFTPFTIQITLRNRNSLQLSNLQLDVDIPQYGIVHQQESLDPLSEKTINIPVYFLYATKFNGNINPPPPSPGTFNVVINLSNNNTQLNNQNKSLTIMNYTIPKSEIITPPDVNAIEVTRNITPEQPTIGEKFIVSVRLKNTKNVPIDTYVSEEYTNIADVYATDALKIIQNATKNSTILNLLQSGEWEKEIHLEPFEEKDTYTYSLLLPPIGFNGTNITGKTVTTVFGTNKTYNPWTKDYQVSQLPTEKDYPFTITIQSPKNQESTEKGNMFVKFWHWITKIV